MVRKNPSLTDEYFIENFITGLKDEIGQMLRMLKPAILVDAMEIAKSQESLIQSMTKQGKSSFKTYSVREYG